ncbi:hypothetical protein HR086_16365 [Myxococcus sp. CA039A]|nr:hypothetical protein [Myxococcus sp. CA039A]
MRRFAMPFLLLAALSACATPSPGPPRARPSGAPSVQGEACPTHKLRFSRETGCMNDGSVEFCLPTGDEALLARVKALAPSIEANPSRGRAGCDLPKETLYFIPTGETECEARHGALTPAAWTMVCDVAALPEVRKLVPTWYE